MVDLSVAVAMGHFTATFFLEKIIIKLFLLFKNYNLKSAKLSVKIHNFNIHIRYSLYEYVLHNVAFSQCWDGTNIGPFHYMVIQNMLCGVWSEMPFDVFKAFGYIDNNCQDRTTRILWNVIHHVLKELWENLNSRKKLALHFFVLYVPEVLPISMVNNIEMGNSSRTNSNILVIVILFEVTQI